MSEPTRRPPARTDDDALLDAQIAYYRARAPEYDAWWRADVNAVERAAIDTLASRRPASVLELACGTGLFTRHLAPRVASVTAIDASPEVIAINRARVAASNVRYVEADVFAWQPQAHYDCVFMSFWLSHVPHARFDALWSMVRRALAPSGYAYVIDSAHDPTSTAVDHPPPDRQAGVVTRRLDDGREYRIVKVFWTPEALAARLAASGFAADLHATARYFVYGSVTDARSVQPGETDVAAGT